MTGSDWCYTRYCSTCSVHINVPKTSYQWKGGLAKDDPDLNDKAQMCYHCDQIRQKTMNGDTEKRNQLYQERAKEVKKVEEIDRRREKDKRAGLFDKPTHLVCTVCKKEYNSEKWQSPWGKTSVCSDCTYGSILADDPNKFFAEKKAEQWKNEKEEGD